VDRIKLWSAAIIDTMEIAHRERGLRALPVLKHELRPHENIRHAVRGLTASVRLYRDENSGD
jgi:hypothetical protein